MAEHTVTIGRGGLPPQPEDIHLAPPAAPAVNWRRVFFIALGLALFLAVYLSPAWPDAIDPAGKHFVLTREGKASLGLFLLALTWWVFEVVPIGVTAVAIGTFQALFLIRPARTAFTDFMDPSVWFIFGSLVIGMVFTHTGLTKRIAYRTLMLVGERTSMIYLGLLRHDRAADAGHGAHRGGGDGVPPADGDPLALRRGGPAHALRQGPVHRHGLRRRRRQHRDPARRGPRAGRDRLLQGHGGPRDLVLRAHLLHAAPRLADGRAAVGLLHRVLQARARHHRRPPRAARAPCTTGWGR